MKTKRRSLISWLLTVMIVFSLIPATEISTYSAGTEESAQPEKWYSGSELTIDEHFIFGEDRMYTEGKANRGFNNLIDNNASTIFYVTTNDTGVNYQDLTGKEISVTFHTNSPVVINYFKIISGGDTFKASYAHRSPTAWNLKAGNSLDSCDNVLLENLPINATVAYEDNTYKFENNTPYKYYKFTITALAGAGRQGHDSPFSNPTATCLLTDIAIGGPEDSRHSSHDGVEFEPWKSANTLPNTEGSYYLTKDVTISSTWSVPSGTTNLCLNGHSITRTNASGTTGSVINVGSSAVLNLYECDDETTHYYTVANPAQNGAGLGTVVDKSAYDAASENARGTFKGGYITGGYATNGGGVCVDGGSFIMYGGTIIGNEAAGNDTRGGGVRIMGSNGSFTMEGGAILANKCSFYGGAIGLGRNSNGGYPNEKSSLTINGGTIRHNWTGKNGGAIHVIGNNSMISAAITGGSIIDNYTVRQSAGSEWGGALIATFISPKISGNPIIKGNICQDNPNDLCVTKGIDLSDHLSSDADVGVSLREPAKLSSSDIQVGINVGKDDIQYLHYSGPDEATLVYCDGSKDWVYSDGKIVEFSGAHHTHAAGTLWASAAKPTASITSGETTTIYGSLSDAVNAWTTGSILKLMADVTASSTITVPSGEHTLDLNGYGILMTGNDRVITINQNASLELNDSNPDSIHYITLTNYRGTAVSDSGETSVSNGNGVIQVTGGYLTGGYRNSTGSHDKCGAGVYNWGTFVMNGGSIVGNTMLNNSGGGIRNSGYFTMNDGAIAFNKATGNGGGVTTYVPGGGQGKMTMTGGVISDNYCGSYGGGIQLAGPFELTGGSVIRNTAGAGGSGIYYGGTGEKFKLSGNPIIKDNINDNLYLNTDATFMINDSLTEDADIGITMNKNAAFTVAWKDKMGDADPSKYFTSDNDECVVYLNDSGEACLKYPDVPNVSANGYEGDYDGETHGITVTVPDGATVKYGTQEGSYTLTDNPTYKDAGTYTVYYEVSKDKHNSVTGSATVKINKINVTVTITGHNSTAVYNGEAHSADGYDAAASSELYDVNNDFTFSGRAEAVRINTGTTYMELSAEQFENTNTNFKTVTFNVTDGYITVYPADSVITEAPCSKKKLVYNGEEQELILAGSVDGGTLLYAIGEDTKSSPADESYSSSVPVASEIGNYYIWYKVEGDSNHNSISPESFKITLADESWITISGKVYQSNGTDIQKGATVFLMKGNTVVDEITSDKNGSYYFTVPAGIYNIVVKSGDVTVTNIVDGQEDIIHDLTTPDADTDSVLDVSAADKSIVVGGLDIEANTIRANEGVSSDKKVTVKMKLTSIKESETNGSQEIGTITQDMSMEFYDMKVEKTIDSVTTALSETQNVLEIVIPCTYTNKRELTVMSSIGSGVQTLTESDSGAAGTYRVDKQAGLIYIYSDRVTTYAIGYKPYFSVKSDISLGSFKGNMSVKLVKDSTKETFELNDVSPDSISFKGIPKGTYSMTITWTDGAENKITLPFTVKK